MSQAWVLLWLPLVGAPTAAETHHLDAWARHEHLQMRPARSVPLPPTATYASEIVSHIEQALENARVALDAGDPTASAGLAQSARAMLTEHPALPQAAWLMAEALQITAGSAAALGDPTGAQLALHAAHGLEGDRASALDGVATSSTASASSGVDVRVTLQGAQPDDTLEWDGIPRAAEGSHWSVPGATELHHARVLRQARPVWAGWVHLPAGAASVTLTVPSIEACSVEDLARFRAPDSASLVRCAAWVAARPATGGAIEVARCHLGRCEPFVRWPSPAPAAALRERENPRESSAWAAPLGYTFLGVAVAATATALLWSATRPDDPDRPVWVYEGIQ